MVNNQQKPSRGYPTSPTSYPSPFPLHIPDVSLKGAAFDQLIKNRGIRFLHRRAAPCPNINNVEDGGHNPLCPICDSNGLLYYAETEIWGLFYSNSLEKNFEQQGMWEIGTAVVTLPTEYSDGSQAEFNTYDQLVIPDFTVRVWELIEYEPTSNRQQQMRYPIVNTDYVGGAVNDILIEFVEGTDFNIVGGNIEWVAGKQPVYDSSTGRGDVIVVNYFCNPVYNVLQQMRELRISQEMEDGAKISKRLPQQVLVRRDFLSNPPTQES